MNAGPADTRSPHLDLEDLIAEVTGQAVGDGAKEHLAACEHCRVEANRWNLVADGVRGLAADASETAEPARPDRPRRTGQRVTGQRVTGQRVLASPWRRVMLVAGSVAAALVLFVGIGTVAGFVHVSLSGHGGQTVLTAVTGCAGLEQATGTLEQVNGTSLVIKTPSGQLVTVTTTASTFVSMTGPLLSDITNGASVDVRGSSSDGTIAAAIVTVGQPFSAVNPSGFVPVRGTVSDASTAGFTLVTSGGGRVRVTTSGSTLVIVPHASLGQLQAGATVFAVGHAGPGGALPASAVAEVSQLPSGPHIGVTSRSCSPASIVEALAG